MKDIAWLGCGEFPMEGAINVDIRKLPCVDVVSDVRKLPFKDGELKGVASRNLIEHFGRHEIVPMLKEWARVVEKDGFVRAETVDGGRLMDKWRVMKEDELLDGLLGAQTYDENFHKMVFSEDIIRRCFDEAGLKCDIEFFEHRDIPRFIVNGTKK